MKNKSGITLIGLITTIVVMLLLSGISIYMMINGNIFNKANRVANMNNNAINTAYRR